MLIRSGKLFVTGKMTKIEKPRLMGNLHIDYLTGVIDETPVSFAVYNVIKMYKIIESECFKKNLTVDEFVALAKENARG